MVSVHHKSLIGVFIAMYGWTTGLKSSLVDNQGPLEIPNFPKRIKKQAPCFKIEIVALIPCHAHVPDLNVVGANRSERGRYFDL